jgi:hypothetical protein
MSIEPVRSYFSRVLKNESTRRGFASAAAGVIIGAVIEFAWPSA